MLQNLYHHRQYIWKNAWQSLRYRYAGSSLGALWNILLPIIQIVIYTTVFAQIFTIRAAGRAQGASAFILYF